MEHGGVAGKPKVVFVLGATATGKSKLAIAIAARFNGEVINADKIQVHDGVPIITNKVTEEERAGVPHHLLGVLHPDADFTAEDFRREAAAGVARVLSAGRLPVVAGGSNTYIEALVEGGGGAFRAAHELLFLWVDAEPALLDWYAALRVDDMAARGLVGEARAAFGGAGADYTRGVRRAIGLPEMHAYLLAEREGGGGAGEDKEKEAELAAMLARAVLEIKENTSRLARAQAAKIRRLSTLDGWDVRRVDVTPVLSARRAGGAACQEKAWETLVWGPCQEMVKAFLETTTTGVSTAPAIGLPEMHAYLLAEREGGGAAGKEEEEEAELAAMLARSVREIKENTSRLTRAQVENIRRLSTLDGWDVHRVDVTPVLVARRADRAPCQEKAWVALVWGQCQEMLKAFLQTPATGVSAAPATGADGGGDTGGAADAEAVDTGHHMTI